MGSTNKVKVSEIFSQAGTAFSKLGELTMQLQTADDGSSKWTDEEIDMLNVAIGRFCSDLSEISFRVKNRAVTQLKQNLKKKAFEEAGIPVKQIVLDTPVQPSHPVVVAAAQPKLVQSYQPTQNIQQIQPVQAIQQIQSQNVIPQSNQQFQTIQQQQSTQITQNVPQYHQLQTVGQQQYQIVQQIQQVPMMTQMSQQSIEITEMTSNDQNDSQDEQVTVATTADTSTSSVISDQSMLTLNRLNTGEPGEVQTSSDDKLDYTTDENNVTG